MNADAFYAYFESALRAWLPTLVDVRFRPSNDFLDISVSGVDDLVIVVTAASGANIRSEIFASFGAGQNRERSLSSCTLRFEVTRHCLDVRLAFFLYEVFGMAVVKGPLEDGHTREEWKHIKMWEDWLSKADDPPTS